MGIYRKKVDLNEVGKASELIGLDTAIALSAYESPFFRAVGMLVQGFLTYECTEQDIAGANLALETEEAFNPHTEIARRIRKAESDSQAEAILESLPEIQEEHWQNLADLRERITALNMLPAHAGLNAMESALLSGKRKSGLPTTVKDLTNRVLGITFPRKGFFFRLAITTPETWALYTVDNGAKTVSLCMTSLDLPNGSQCASMSKARKICASYIDYHGVSGKDGVSKAFKAKFADFNQGGVSNVSVVAGITAKQWPELLG